MSSKICSKCKQELERECFNKQKSSKDGLNAWCKKCRKEYGIKYNEEHPNIRIQNHKKHYEDNKETIIKKQH